MPPTVAALPCTRCQRAPRQNSHPQTRYCRACAGEAHWERNHRTANAVAYVLPGPALACCGQWLALEVLPLTCPRCGHTWLAVEAP